MMNTKNFIVTVKTPNVENALSADAFGKNVSSLKYDIVEKTISLSVNDDAQGLVIGFLDDLPLPSGGPNSLSDLTVEPETAPGYTLVFEKVFLKAHKTHRGDKSELDISEFIEMPPVPCSHEVKLSYWKLNVISPQP